MMHNTNFLNFFLISILFLLCNGCAKITEEARLDRFEEKLVVNKLEVEKKLNEDLASRENNLISLKKDIVFLKSKIKNTGKIIPGHGGLLDRIDGMIFAFPFSYIIFSLN